MDIISAIYVILVLILSALRHWTLRFALDPEICRFVQSIQIQCRAISARLNRYVGCATQGRSPTIGLIRARQRGKQLNAAHRPECAFSLEGRCEATRRTMGCSPKNLVLAGLRRDRAFHEMAATTVRYQPSMFLIFYCAIYAHLLALRPGYPRVQLSSSARTQSAARQ
jgi:hypothetical protein